MFKSALILSSAEAGTETMFELQPLSTSSKSSSKTWFKFIVNSFDEGHRTIEHCHGLISAEAGTPGPLHLGANHGFMQLESWTNRKRQPPSFYEKLNKLGLQYGEDFRLISEDSKAVLASPSHSSLFTRQRSLPQTQMHAYCIQQFLMHPFMQSLRLLRPKQKFRLMRYSFRHFSSP